MLRARDGWVEFHLDRGAVTNDQPALVYSSYAPAFAPPSSTLQQVGPVLTATLANGVSLNGTLATVNIFYRDNALPGLDEFTLGLYRWDDSLSAWQRVPSDLGASRNLLSASLTELGVFALFAEPSDDTDAPGRIEDLQATASPGGWNVRLDWTATGDDGPTGSATTYVLRFSPSEITADNNSSASLIPLSLVPHVAGTPETYTIAMPSPGAQYYFALQAIDEAGNLGPLSNIAAARSHEDDSDGDGMPDQWEATYGLNPYDPSDAAGDADDDGLTNRQECELGTNPKCWDTDGDGVSDTWEQTHGLKAFSTEDGQGDADHDGLSNAQEYQAGTDPNDPDTDHDGLPDKWEVDHRLCAFSASGDNGAEGDPDHDGLSNIQEYRLSHDPAVWDNLRIASCVVRSNGVVELAVQGKLGEAYTLEASTNLTDWFAVTRFTCTNSPTAVLDANTAGYRHKFYRVVLQTTAVEIRLQLLSVPLPDSGVELSLSGPVGQTYRIETSTNLTDWSSLTNFVSALPSMVVDKIAITNDTRRFFRAVAE